MAEIVELAHGEDPPGTGQWIMVVSGPDYRELEIKRHALGTTYMAPSAMETAVIEQAVEIARNTGAGPIYVRRSGDNSGLP
jgi:hypothetical protein